jgi:hypothetical protein
MNKIKFKQEINNTEVCLAYDAGHCSIFGDEYGTLYFVSCHNVFGEKRKDGVFLDYDFGAPLMEIPYYNSVKLTKLKITNVLNLYTDPNNKYLFMVDPLYNNILEVYIRESGEFLFDDQIKRLWLK